MLPAGGVGKEAEHAERKRQAAVDAIRDQIERLTQPVHSDQWRILFKTQAELWDEGVRAGEVLKPAALQETSDDEDEEESDDIAVEMQSRFDGHARVRDYVAGKWGRYLRAPDLYFEIMSRFRNKFVPLGKIADIRFGVKTGCDAFFMPRDVTEEVLTKRPSEKEFRSLTGVSREAATNGTIRIVKDGAGTLHPIESEYVKPEVHSLMKVDRPVIRARDLDRVVLLVNGSSSEPLGKYVHKYIKYGEKERHTPQRSQKLFRFRNDPPALRVSCGMT